MGLKSALMKATTRHGSGYKQFLDQHVLTAGELRSGDILLVKLYEDYAHWKRVDAIAPYAGEIGSDGTSIVAAQAVFSHMRGGSASSEHAMIVAEDGRERVYESVGSGVECADTVKDRWHAVYRVVATRQALANEAVRVARSLARQINLTAGPGYGQLMAFPPTPGQAHESSVSYRGQVSMAASVFRSKRAGVLRNARLNRVYDAVYNASPAEARKARNGLAMICTEFVTTCYEVAALRLDVPPLFNVDPRAMSAKAFEAVLKRRSAEIQLVGIFKGSDNIVHTCPTCNGQVRCMYLTDEHGERFGAVRPDGKRVFPYVTICPQCNRCNCGSVWSAAPIMVGPLNFHIRFYCASCDEYPVLTTDGASAADVKQLGGHVNERAGMRVGKPKKSDDAWFVR